MRSKESLEEAKKTFLRELNKRDPMWRDKMRTRKLEDIKRMEMTKDKLKKELSERQRQLEEEMMISEKIKRMQDENDEKQNEIREVDRQRRNI
jgi:hypothetical protein